MEQRTPLVSIVVPVYKARDYLPDCLASIRGQSEGDWECILVDDGSPDGSGEVCDAAAAQDGRFSVLHKANAGVSAARNDGIERAKGRYLVFLDADDELAPCALAAALAAAGRHPGDLVCWRMTRRQSELPAAGAPAPAESCYNASQAQVYRTTVDGHSSCNKLLELSLLRQAGVRFDPALARAEDYMFVGAYLDAFFAARPGAAIRQLEAPLYYWRETPGSATHSITRRDRRGRVGWDPKEFRDYARRLAEEYRAAKAAMGGWDAMSEQDLAPQLRTYLRRFAFAVWTAKQLGEALPADFFDAGPVAELLAMLKERRLFSAYYLPFKLRSKGLIAAVYASEESGRMTLYRRFYTIGFYTLLLATGRRWKQA